MKSRIIKLTGGEPYLLKRGQGLAITRVSIWSARDWVHMENLSEFDGPFFKKTPLSPDDIFYTSDKF